MQHQKPSIIFTLLLKCCSSGTGIFHIAQLSKTFWTQFLLKLHLVLEVKRLCCSSLSHGLILLYSRLRDSSSDLWKNTMLIKPLVHGPGLRIIHKKAWFIKEEEIRIPAKLNSEGQVTSNVYRPRPTWVNYPRERTTTCWAELWMFRCWEKRHGDIHVSEKKKKKGYSCLKIWAYIYGMNWSTQYVP